MENQAIRMKILTEKYLKICQKTKEMKKIRHIKKKWFDRLLKKL